MPTTTHSNNFPSKRKTQLDAVLIQLSSQRPSDIWRGMEQVRQWLKEDPEDREVYGLLLDAVQKNRDLREQVRNLFVEMEQKGSKIAEQAIVSLPSGIQDLLADADDVYYAADYERAIQLYRQVLRLDAENAHAKDHIAKAEINRITGESATGLPRTAEQYYRRARSYIAVRDVITAMNLLSAAIETAQAKGMKYPDAEEALNNMQNLLTADEFRQKAKLALDKGQWKESSDLYNNALMLDATNAVMKKEHDSLQDLLRAEMGLKKQGVLKIFMSTSQLQNTIETVRTFVNPDNPLLSFVERQLLYIRWARTIGVVLLLFIVIFPIYLNGNLRSLFNPAMTNTPAITQTVTVTPASTPTHKVIPTDTKAKETQPIIATSTTVDTETPAPILTETVTPIPTEVILGIGFMNKGIASTLDVPNGRMIERLGLNHPLTIFEKREVTGSTWYRCRWNSNGTTKEGWILAENINFGPPPTPR